VEVYEQKYGYNPRTESMTGYVRRRFHLVQGGNPQLWLIHYLRAPDEGNHTAFISLELILDRLPVAHSGPLPYPPPPRPYPLPNIAKIEFVISNTGQLVSFKNPNTSWAPNMPPAQHYPPQQPYVNRQPQVQPPPYRPQPQLHPQGNKRVKVEDEEEEEPFLPRDIAAQRFVRWTEWMEEILSSGYNIRTHPSNPILMVGDILPPPSPLEGLRPEVLVARTQALENDIRVSKQQHEETLQKFKSSCKVWKDGSKKLAMTSNVTQDLMAARVDGVAAAAKDADSAVSLALTQSSSTDEVEEINRQVLADSGIPHARIRKVQKVRPVGKHIEYEPAKKNVTAPPGPTVIRSPSKPMEEVAEPVVPQETATAGVEVEMESVDGADGHANEAFEAMEAMDFDATAEFDYDSENHGSNDVGMDMGVD
jgi:hypothetical protein